MPKSLSYTATEWFCDNCPTSAIVIRKNDWEPLLPEGWNVRQIKRKWYQFDKWELRCASCSTASFLKMTI